MGSIMYLIRITEILETYYTYKPTEKHFNDTQFCMILINTSVIKCWIGQVFFRFVRGYSMKVNVMFKICCIITVITYFILQKQ